MFVGFIAIIVVLLIIVAAMSTGSTSGSGGVDQTQATKVLSEFSGLTQSFDFYKTTTTLSDYEGISVPNLVKNGIVNTADTADAGNDGLAGTTDDVTPAVNNDFIVSKALDGVTYTVAPDANTNAKKVTTVTIAGLVSDSAADAIASTLTSKLASSATVVSDGLHDNANGKAGTITITE